MSKIGNNIAVQREEPERIGENRGIEQGLEQDIARGLQRGIEQGKIEVAKNFKLLGIDVKKIAEATGLPIEQIQNL